jgi:predicted flap endonuclease-1-like 5' DNA nuclease
MDFLLGLVIGLIVGLLINWVLAPLLDRRDASGLQQTLHSLQERIEDLEAAQVSGPIKAVVVRAKDDFESIPGIDALSARRLNEAGIYTFEQLSALEPEGLRRLAQVDEGRTEEVQRWIESARGRTAGQTV